MIYSFLWFPYLSSIYFLYKKRETRIYATSIIIIFALLGYRLPLFSELHAPLFYVGSMFTLLLFIFKKIINRQILLVDSYLFKVVVVYFVFFLLSVIFNFEESQTIATYIVRIIGFFPLFLLTVDSLNCKRDLEKLFISIMIGGTLMAIIGIGQFYFADSLWGIQSTRKIDKISGSEYFTESKEIGFGSFLPSGFRISSSASNPNSFSAVMCLTIILTIYQMKVSRKKKINFILLLMFLAQIVGLIISGSRTGLFTIVLLAFLSFALNILKRGKLMYYAKSSLFGILLIYMLGTYMLSNEFLRGNVIERYLKIFVSGKSGFFSGGSRIDRAWIPYIKRISPDMFVIGYGTPGIPSAEDQDQMSRTTHNDLLGILYFTGFWGFSAFILIILRYFMSLNKVPDVEIRQLLIFSMLAYLIFGLSAESFIHKGQPYIFWPLIAIVAKRKTLFNAYSTNRFKVIA